MRQLLIPIILVAVAIGLFVLYTNPSYQAVKALQAQVSAYDDALNTSQELRTTPRRKNRRVQHLLGDDKQRLQRILPDNIDNIHLIIDINSIAARHGLLA